MPSIPPVPLMRHEIVRPLVGLLDVVGSPVASLLSGAGLSPGIQNGFHGYGSGRSVFEFAGNSADSQGISDFCWRAILRAPPIELGPCMESLRREATLEGALQRFCLLWPKEIPFVRVGLEFGEDHAWMWRVRPFAARKWAGDIQAEQYIVAWMIRVVRLVAGPGWMPSHIDLEKDDTGWRESDSALSGAQIRIRTGRAAIGIPYPLLDKPIRTRTDVQQRHHSSVAGDTRIDSLGDSLQQLIEPLLGHLQPSLELGASIAEMRPRTLDRRLRDEGTHWRQIVDRARFQACKRMFQNPDLTLAAIATELGYSDHAHLTRAFRRWTGDCPQEYRRKRYGVSLATRL